VEVQVDDRDAQVGTPGVEAAEVAFFAGRWNARPAAVQMPASNIASGRKKRAQRASGASPLVEFRRMSKSANNSRAVRARYAPRTRGVRSPDRVALKGRSTGEVVVYRRAASGRFATQRSAKAVDRTVHRYSDALKRLAKR